MPTEDAASPRSLVALQSLSFSQSVSYKDLQPLKHPACWWLVPLCIVAPTVALAVFLMVKAIRLAEDDSMTFATRDAAVNRYQLTLVAGVSCYRGLSHVFVRYMMLSHCAAFRNRTNSLQNQTVDMLVSFFWGPAHIIMATFVAVKVLSMSPETFIVAYLAAARMYSVVLLVDQWFELAALKLHSIFDASYIAHHVGELIGAALTLEWLHHPFPGLGILLIQQSYDRIARVCFAANRLIPREGEVLADPGKVDELIAIVFSSWIDEVTWMRMFGCYYALVRIAIVVLGVFYMSWYETLRVVDYALLSAGIVFFIVVDVPVYQWLAARMWRAKSSPIETADPAQREPVHVDAEDARRGGFATVRIDECRSNAPHSTIP